MSYDAINKYNIDNYEMITIRVPKGKRTLLENLSKLTGQSINALVLGAVEEKYDVSLRTKNVPISEEVRHQYLHKRLKFFEDINYSRIKDVWAYVKGKTDTIKDNQRYIEKVDVIMSQLIMAFYDKQIDNILDDIIY